MPRTFDRVVVACEHASAAVPHAYAPLFANARARAALRTHQGYDLGARPVARSLARAFGVPLHAGRFSRLLVDLNRSPHNPAVWSRWSRKLSPEARAHVMRTYYLPYRDGVEAALRTALAGKRRALHLSVHSFTPRFAGQARTADIGLLYDPRRPAERTFAARVKIRLAEIAPTLRIRRNYPYSGITDGFTPWLRRHFDRRYVALEIEINQARLDDLPERAAITRALHAALAPELDAHCA